MQQCVYETKICDIGDLQKRLLYTGFHFEQMLSTLRLSSGATVWDCVRAGGGHFEHMLWNYCSFVLCSL